MVALNFSTTPYLNFQSFQIFSVKSSSLLVSFTQEAFAIVKLSSVDSLFFLLSFVTRRHLYLHVSLTGLPTDVSVRLVNTFELFFECTVV